MIEKFLNACASFSWTMESSMISLFLFGEAPYPTPTEQNH